MSDQTDMDEVQADLQTQSGWGEPVWYGMLLRVARVVNAIRLRVVTLGARSTDHETRLADLEKRVKALENPPAG